LTCLQKNFPDTKANALFAKSVARELISAAKWGVMEKRFAAPVPANDITNHFKNRAHKT
jgi:hypothetical protein